MSEKRQLLKSASIISLATIAGRILGYLRDQRLTLLLGTSGAADSFILAFRIPNLVRRLVAEGTMTAAFIPVFAGYLRERSEGEVREFAESLFWTMALVAAGIAALGFLFSPQVIYLFTLFGRSRLDWGMAVYLNRIIFPYVFLISLAALASAILNSYREFGIPAVTPALFNLTIIVFSTAVVYVPLMRLAPQPYRSPAVALAVGVLVGGVVQVLAQVPSLMRRGMRFRFRLGFAHPGVRQVGKLMLPGLFGLGVYQINFFLDTVFTTSARMPAGSITALYVADRVMQLVLGTYAIAIATAILPMMSHQAAAQDLKALKGTFNFALRIVSFITIPAMVGLVVLRGPIVRVLFGHGQFGAESTSLTARALFYYALGLPAFAAVRLIVPGFYSLRDTRTPVLVGAGSLVLNVLANTVLLLLFFRYVRNGGPALASSIAAYFNFLALIVVFRRRYGRLGGRVMATSLVRSVVCALVMGLAAWEGVRWSGLAAMEQFLASLAVLLAVVAVAVLVYVALAWLLRSPELREVRDIVFRAEKAPEMIAQA